MVPADMCRHCGGMMQFINDRGLLIKCPYCKDSHGWSAVAWQKEQDRIAAARAGQEKKEEKPQ